MSPSSSTQQITKYTRHFFSGTLLSRVSGMLRDVSMAAVFGDHPSVAAFMVAFRFSHFLRRVLGEGALQSVFIPHYQEIRLKDETDAKVFFFRLTLLITLALTALILLIEGAAALGFWHFSCFQNSEVTHLFAWMLPSLLFICLYGLNISVLQCQNAFFFSSIAPLSCNLIWIFAIFTHASSDVPQAMVSLAMFTLIGFAIQWLLTLGRTKTLLLEGLRHFKPPVLHLPSEIKTIGKATLFGLLGVTAVQINSFLDMIFARYADLKGPIYLWYAIRLEQLPLALVGFACVYSIVPTLSKLIKAQSLPEAQELFSFGYRRIFLLVVPCTFALFALGFASINLLFGRGHFSSLAVSETTLCLWAYGLSLLPSTLIIYQSSLFYAHGDYRTPTIASIVAVLSNIALNILFVFGCHWGAVSIALSTSISAVINYGILKILFTKKGYWQVAYPRLLSLGRVSLACLLGLAGCLMFDKLYMGAYFFEPLALNAPRLFSCQLLYLAEQGTIFLILFCLCLLLTGRQTLVEMKALVFSSK